MTHTSHIIEIQKTSFGIEPQFSKILKFSKSRLSNLDANRRSFDVFEITKTIDSLTLILS
jgi:hypothetical protein